MCSLNLHYVGGTHGCDVPPSPFLSPLLQTQGRHIQGDKEEDEEEEEEEEIFPSVRHRRGDYKNRQSYYYYYSKKPQFHNLLNEMCNVGENQLLVNNADCQNPHHPFEEKGADRAGRRVFNLAEQRRRRRRRKWGEPGRHEFYINTMSRGRRRRTSLHSSHSRPPTHTM